MIPFQRSNLYGTMPITQYLWCNVCAFHALHYPGSITSQFVEILIIAAHHVERLHYLCRSDACVCWSIRLLNSAAYHAFQQKQKYCRCPRSSCRRMEQVCEDLESVIQRQTSISSVRQVTDRSLAELRSTGQCKCISSQRTVNTVMTKRLT